MRCRPPHPRHGICHSCPETHSRAPASAIGLVTEKPDDLVLKVPFRGTRQRYAQASLWQPNSVRLTIVLDEIGHGAADLYIDSNRNRRIETADRVEGRIARRLPLDVAIVEGETTRYEHRAAIFRLGATGITFSYAAAGYLEGNADFAGRKHAVRALTATVTACSLTLKTASGST